ncbi:BrnT-like toxin [Gordonia phage Eyre]|uniref:Toxin n=1 Tax=Gordonia phage Eyre TaxID=1887646 RepID=A0A1B3AZZ6_9CAUD|nr:toxin [Gordonia phage Eyre]AOE44311.1 BrnT-like toxin [Gordonia phage Eyre]
MTTVEHAIYTRVMSKVRMTAAARRRASKTRVMAALRNAGNPLLVDGNRAYYIGTDNRGIELELILTANPDGSWTCIHAMPTHYRKNWE